MSAVSVLGRSKEILCSAAVCVEGLKQEQIQNQKTLLKLQDDLLRSKTDQVEAVQKTVETEMRSFSDVVKHGCEGKAASTQVIKAAVKSAVLEDGQKRSVMVFGLGEGPDESVRRKVEDMLSVSCGTDKPSVSDCYRVGEVKEGAERPIKVLLNSSETAARVLRNARVLRGSTRFKKVYVSPDRSREEREQRRTLVAQIKEKISSEPGQYHYIKNGTVCSREKQQPPSSHSSTAASSSSSLRATAPAFASTPLSQRPSRAGKK